MVKTSRAFNFESMLVAAQSGELTGAALKKAIKLAQDFGKSEISRKMQLCVVQSSSFAGDAAPEEVRARVAQGISALNGMGHTLSRTKQMIGRHGVIETMNRIAKYADSTKNFDRLREAGLEHLTAEAIVLDYPDLFSKEAVEYSRKRLGR